MVAINCFSEPALLLNFRGEGEGVDDAQAIWLVKITWLTSTDSSS